MKNSKKFTTILFLCIICTVLGLIIGRLSTYENNNSITESTTNIAESSSKSVIDADTTEVESELENKTNILLNYIIVF